MNLGKSIIDLCNIRGISQRELASKTGLSVTFHSLMENNLRSPSMDTLTKLASALRVPLFVIFYYALEDSDVNSKKMFVHNKFRESLTITINDLYVTDCFHIRQNYDPAPDYNRCMDCGQLVKCKPNNFPVLDPKLNILNDTL